MKYLFLIYIILNPLFFLINIDLRQAQEFFFQASSIALLLCSMFFENKGVRKDKINLFIGIFGLWFLIEFLMYNQGWSILINSFLGILVYFTVIKTLKKEDIPFLIKGLFVVGIITALHLAGQYFGYDLRGQITKDTANLVPDCSFWGLKAAMGIFYSLLIPLSLCLGWVGLLFLLPLGLSYATTAIIAVGVSIVFFYWFRQRIIVWIIIPVILIAGLFYILKIDAPMGMLGTRMPVWGMVLQDAHKRPLGYGLDSFRNSYSEGAIRYFKDSGSNVTLRAVKKGDGFVLVGKVSADLIERMKNNGKGNALDFWDHPHNEFVWLLYETGFPGIFLLGVILYYLWDRFRRSRKDIITLSLAAGIIAFMINSIGHFPFHLARNGSFFPVLLGMFYISTEE